jgi:hypothetical protein
MVVFFPSIIELLAHPVDVIKKVGIGDAVVNGNIEFVGQHKVIEIKLNFCQQTQINIFSF